MLQIRSACAHCPFVKHRVCSEKGCSLSFRFTGGTTPPPDVPSPCFPRGISDRPAMIQHDCNVVPQLTKRNFRRREDCERIVFSLDRSEGRACLLSEERRSSTSWVLYSKHLQSDMIPISSRSQRRSTTQRKQRQD